MFKKISIAVVLVISAFSASVAYASTTIALYPQPGVTLMGVSCGGIHTTTYVTGFDINGNITGEEYSWTRCGGSGRGGGYKTHTYTAWHAIVWDTNGVALVTLPYDGVALDASFTATDTSGNTIDNLGYNVAELIKA